MGCYNLKLQIGGCIKGVLFTPKVATIDSGVKEIRIYSEHGFTKICMNFKSQ